MTRREQGKLGWAVIRRLDQVREPPQELLECLVQESERFRREQEELVLAVHRESGSNRKSA